jgi:hypothetical protein
MSTLSDDVEDQCLEKMKDKIKEIGAWHYRRQLSGLLCTVT